MTGTTEATNLVHGSNNRPLARVTPNIFPFGFKASGTELRLFTPFLVLYSISREDNLYKDKLYKIRTRGLGSTASLQEGDLRLPGPPTGQGAGGGARTRDKRAPADIGADSLTSEVFY
ncbi:hypothetical protein PoB_004567900 [Plakobranchus ocellatus]|uniref:Uncharacterized protein n=1 Tax=Plakobranchus ocellatus TaxID=259542 RepID=A0AAV4BGF6_9GAST|nr:hypothetical protein PoB_004567900 [Plakobranchus ocellatus]